LQEGFIKVFTRLHQYKFNGELGAAMNYVRLNSKVFELNGPSFTKDIDAIVLQAEPKSLSAVIVTTKKTVNRTKD